MLSFAIAISTPWEGIWLLQPGCYLIVPEILNYDLLEDSTEVSECRAVTCWLCNITGSQHKGEAVLVSAGHSQRAPECLRPETAPGTGTRQKPAVPCGGTTLHGRGQASRPQRRLGHSTVCPWDPACQLPRRQNQSVSWASEWRPSVLSYSLFLADNTASVFDACLHLSLLITYSLRKGFQDTLLRGSISYTSEEKKQPLSQTLKPLRS